MVTYLKNFSLSFKLKQKMMEYFLDAPIEWNPEEPCCNKESDSTFDVC